jgi:enoyl-CoA hydratase/carnithine racemase
VVSIEAIGLIRKMPAEAVMRMAFVGKYERMNAQRAYELGMISQIVDPPGQLREEAQALAEKIAKNSPADPPGQLREEAQALAEKIAKNSPAAMQATKKALWGALEHNLTDACKVGAKHLAGLWGHPDQDEGPKAFAEKREPRWAALPARDGTAG